jgi:hypothetical protein
MELCAAETLGVCSCSAQARRRRRRQLHMHKNDLKAKPPSKPPCDSQRAACAFAVIEATYDRPHQRRLPGGRMEKTVRQGRPEYVAAVTNQRRRRAQESSPVGWDATRGRPWLRRERRFRSRSMCGAHRAAAGRAITGTPQRRRRRVSGLRRTRNEVQRVTAWPPPRSTDGPWRAGAAP